MKITWWCERYDKPYRYGSSNDHVLVASAIIYGSPIMFSAIIEDRYVGDERSQYLFRMVCKLESEILRRKQRLVEDI